MPCPYPLPRTIDSTMLNSFRSCHRQFYNNYIRRLEPKGLNIDLLAGAAFARGLEVARRSYYENHLSADISVGYGLAALLQAYGDPPVSEDEVKTWDRVAAAYESYFANFPLETDPIRMSLVGELPAIEFTFCIPIEEVLHPVTSQPILVSGRCDWLGDLRNSLFCMDEKTTKAFHKNWAESWQLRSQFMMYTWAAQQYDLPIKGTIVRGTAIQKTQIQHLEAIIYQPEWKLDRWYEQLVRDLQKIVLAWIEDYWDFNYGESCTHWGGCAYAPICNMKDDSRWLDVYYQENKWNPLEKTSPFIQIGAKNAA